MNNERSVCPVCGQYTFEGYDICKVCFWEDDPIQEDEPNYGGGANNLCLNDYKKWWQKLNRKLPPLMQKYGLKRLAETLKKSDNPRILWEQLTPDLSVAPNPKYLAHE